jgi:hypothetical protein
MISLPAKFLRVCARCRGRRLKNRVTTCGETRRKGTGLIEVSARRGWGGTGADVALPDGRRNAEERNKKQRGDDGAALLIT